MCSSDLRVGENLLVAGHAGVEADLTKDFPGSAKGASGKHLTIFQGEFRGAIHDVSGKTTATVVTGTGLLAPGYWQLGLGPQTAGRKKSASPGELAGQSCSRSVLDGPRQGKQVEKTENPVPPKDGTGLEIDLSPMGACG